MNTYLPCWQIQLVLPDARRKAVKRIRRMHRTCEAVGIEPQDLWPYYRITCHTMGLIQFLKLVREGTFRIDTESKTLHAKNWGNEGMKAK